MKPFFPKRLRTMARKMERLLRNEESVVIYHDGDADGIISAAILEDFLEREEVEFVAFSRGREHTPFTEWDRYIVLDIGFDEGMAQRAKENRAIIYYVDHHEPDVLPPRTSILNPWFTKIKLVPPHRYNTGLLAWLLEGMSEENEWKAALSNYADGSVDIHTRRWVEGFLEKYGERFAEAARMVNMAVYFPDLRGEEIREIVRRAESLEDILSTPMLRERKEALDRAIEELEEKIREAALSSGRLVYLVFPEMKLRIVGVATTRVSFQFKDKMFVVGFIDDDRVRYIIRFQNAEKYGIHMGKIAREAAKIFGGGGGGHPPAAGLRIPVEKEPEFREWVKRRFEEIVK